MANLLASYPNISELSYGLITVSRPARRTRLINGEGHIGYVEIKTTNCVVHCSSSSSGSSSSSTSSTEEVGFVGSGKFGIDSKGEFKYLVSEYGWKVRSLFRNGDEVRKAAQVQAEAFHEPVFLFNDLFFQFFQAEVLSGLVYKLRNSPPNRYACLVAEPTPMDTSESQELVGVVDLTASRDQNVLEHLPPDADEFLYVSGIAVLKSFRRKKVATVLLKACDMLSAEWGFKYLALRAYEDDFGARELYANAGYRVVSSDPPWMSTWIGRKRRVVMIKQILT
ncbi:uncharacterized protein LOC112183399 [Rosa chinensis]|nr:uncharacterized protein LOC112183399 [Rosa chinensis]